MAEFALGLTKAAVEGTLSRVKSAIEEEAKIKEAVQHDLVFIMGEFQMMQSFLNVANKERAKNEVVRTWVRQLRDLAFDVEDCVEFVVHLDKRSSSWWWRVVPSCMAPPQRMDEAAAEIKLLKARVEDVSQRNMRYNLISDSGSHSKTTTAPLEPPAPASARSSAFHNLRDVWDAAWKIRDMGNLQDLITREGSELQVISIWSSTRGDPGATSILREAYYDPKICREFKSRAWVKVVHPFNPDDFLRSLLARFCASSGRRYEGVDHLRQGELMQQVKEHKYLLVLEQVSTVAEWEDIRMCLPDSQNGSRIVTATQDLGIALLCAGKPYLVSELRRLSDGQSLCAFFRKVAGRRSDMGELKYQIHRHGVTAVLDYAQSKSTFVKRLYQSIMHKGDDFDGVKFGTHRWVHVVNPFDLTDFSRRLFIDLSPYGVHDIGYDFNTLLSSLSSKYHSRTIKYIEEVLKMGELDLIEGCRRFLCKEDCLIVIDGLLQKSEWYKIKSTFLSEVTKGSSIVVITGNDSVATDSVDDKDRVLNSELGRVVCSRKEEAQGWLKSFKPVRHGYFTLGCSPGVLSVWGIAGVGKSALVRNEYYDHMLSFRLPFQMYSWADVPDPFNLMDFSRRLLLDFHSDDLPAKETTILGIIEGQDPIQACRTFLSEYKCLVVIDGLRSKDDWDLIKDTFLSGPTKGCVVVITNEGSVARHCADEERRVVNVKCLESDETLRLWQQEITLRGMQLNHDEMELSKHILAKCGGLPKIITALGEYLKSDYRMSIRGNLESINDGFMSYMENNTRFHSLRGLFSWMQSYFEACKDSLKPCIFYLSVFSGEDNIKRRRLLRRWIAEGYSRDTSSGTALENGERLFSELVKLSIIKQTSSKSMCQVNGFFHQYIISRPMEDNLVFALEGSCSTTSQRVGQHLTIRSSWDREKVVFESIDFSRLRSLTVFGMWMPFFISTNINMRLLRVLDLEDSSGLTNDDLEQIGKLLPRLKFLSLKGCTEITRLPDSMGDLRQLQTLDARHTSIVKLPHAIIQLHKLQYICVGTSNEPWEGCMVTSLSVADEDISSTHASDHTGPSQLAIATTPIPSEYGGVSTEPGQPARTRSKPHSLVSSRFSMLFGKRKLVNVGVEVPTGFGRFATLHTLGIVNVSGACGKEILKELQILTQLRKLGLCGINRQNYKELCSAVPCFRHLETLSVQADKDKEEGFFCCFDDISKPPKTLKSLKLHGHIHKLPAWVNELDNLKKLDLEMTMTTQEGMEGLSSLPSRHGLRRLCVKPSTDGELQFKLPDGCTHDSFSVLEIECTSRLKVTFGYSISGPEVLKVNCSSGSSLDISGLENLIVLKEVWLKGSYGDELRQYVQHYIERVSRYSTKPVLKLVRPRFS